MPQIFIKDPQAILDYQINWASWLGADTISTSTWTVPAGITKVSDSNTTTTTTIWLSGGTVDTDYDIVNHIKTVGTREDDRTIHIQVRQK